MSTLIPPVEGKAPLWLWSWYCQRSPGIGCHMPDTEGETEDDAGRSGSRPAPVHAEEKTKMGTVRTATSFTFAGYSGSISPASHQPKETTLSTKFFRVSSAALIGLALVAAACSKGSDSAPSPTSSASPTSSVSSSGSPSASSSVSASATTFTGNGVSFDYPSDWQQFTLTGTTAQSGSSLWTETVGTDPINFASVAGYTINIPITADNIAAQKDALSQQIKGLFQQAGGAMTGGPTDETMAGFPALGFTGTAKNPNGATVSSRLVLAFDGTTEYFVNCQFDDTGQTAILAGCDQIVSTFTVG